MPEIEFSFSESFQDSMIALMLTDVGFCKKTLSYIPKDRLYSEKQKYLFNQIQRKMDKDGTLLSYIEAEDSLKRIDKIKRGPLKKYLKFIYHLNLEDRDYIKEKLTEYAKKNAFISVFMGAQTLWNSKKYGDAYEKTFQGITELYSIDFRDDAIVRLKDFEDIRINHVLANMDNEKRIPTRIEDLDNILRGGLEKGELGILLALPKHGKSLGLLHMGCAALMSRSGRVAHFVLEGTTTQSVMRYQSRLSGIRYHDLEKDNLTDKQRLRLAELDKLYLNRLDLIPFNKHWEYSVGDVEAKIKELESVGRKPDLVVIDYADLLKSKHREKEKRFEQTEVYRDIKRLAMIKDVAIWSATQAQRPKDAPDVVGILRAQHVSESYEKVRIADLIITLNQTPNEKKQGLLRFHIDIYRSSDSDKTVYLLVDFERMIFASPKGGAADRRNDLSFPWMLEKKRR
jgi:replicative DNA helicase